MSTENIETKENQVQDQQSNNDKIGKNYEAGFKKLIALFQGSKEVFKKTKVANGDIKTLVDELMKEKKETAAKELKEEFKKLLDAKIVFDQECKKAEEAYIKAVNDKKKEFTEKMSALFNRIENVAEIEKSYYTSLGGTAATEETK